MKNQNESRLRRKLASQGYSLRKSRVKGVNADNLGGFMITDSSHNAIVAGERFNLTLEDVESFANGSD